MRLMTTMKQMLRSTRRRFSRFQQRMQQSRGQSADNVKRRNDRYERASASNTYDAIDFMRSETVRTKHEAVATQIRNRLAMDTDSKLRIAFVVSSPSRWNCDSLLEAISDHPRMEAELIARRPEYRAPETDIRSLYEESLAFFSQLGVPVLEGYDVQRQESIPIEDFNHDVFFFEMPWGMRDYPMRMTGRALPAYLHYGFMMMANHGMHYNVASFHSYLWRYFAQTESHRRLHLEHDPSSYEQIVVTGYPKLDVYQRDQHEKATEPVVFSDARTTAPKLLDSPVIYAPHHSLGKEYLSMKSTPEKK